MRVAPDSINLKMSDREVPDGSLQESVNIQWRDGSNKPIPYREVSGIDVGGHVNTIAHKVGDENTINILGFGESDNLLYWIGTITDGVYAAKIPVVLISGIEYTDGLSYTILNGVIYFIGDGTSDAESYYYSIQYNETTEEYEVNDIYDWKDIEFSSKGSVSTNLPSQPSLNTFRTYSTCGIVFIRYTFVLNTGEEVLHSTIYPHIILGYNALAGGSITIGADVDNIHCCVNKQMVYNDIDEDLIKEKISSVKVYASTPKYKPKFEVDDTAISNELYKFNYTDDEIIADIKERSDTVFYNIGTFKLDERKYGNEYDNFLLLYVDSASTDVEDLFTDKVNMSTITAGEVMPVDDFTHHSIYGKISSFNGRLLIESPTIKMTNGIVSNNGLSTLSNIKQGFKASTEDGIVTSPEVNIYNGGNNNITPVPIGYVGNYILCRGILGYPDIRATEIATGGTDDPIYSIDDPNNPGNILIPDFVSTKKFNSVASTLNNLSLALDFVSIDINYTMGGEGIDSIIGYDIRLLYQTDDDFEEGSKSSYTSNNKVQFSEAGEFSVFPAENSYRIGDGKVVFVGINRVNPENADVVAPLIIGTTDGIYTLNLDITGAVLVNSITKTKNLPAISAETLEIEGALLFVSDKGLMVINNGNVENLTNKVFPEQNMGAFDFPDPDTVYPNYDSCLKRPSEVDRYIDPLLYKVDDIVDYMKGCLMAYDGRRNNLWCSNPNYNFSLVYSLELNKWSMSTIVFDEKVELFSVLDGYYSRFLVKGSQVDGGLGQNNDNLLILSAEDVDSIVPYHLLTRPMKLGAQDSYKKIVRFVSRCQLYNATGGVFSLGLWGKQDINKMSTAIPLVSISDNVTYKNGTRQDIPVGTRKGKYKSITVLQSGVAAQDSSIDSFDFDILGVDGNKLR